MLHIPHYMTLYKSPRKLHTAQHLKYSNCKIIYFKWHTIIITDKYQPYYVYNT